MNISTGRSGSHRTVLRLWLAAILLIWGAAMAAAQTPSAFPALTGRVVDNASLIDPATRASLDAKLADLEKRSSDQIVVATINTLGGQDIDSYANELFRTWKLGYSGSNNGILLLVAKDDRKMRIEVGYGLEGTVTDALSSLIINSIMAPAFRAGDYSGGISKAVDGLVTIIDGNPDELRDRYEKNADRIGGSDGGGIDPIFAIFIFIWIVIFVGGFGLAILAPIFGTKLGPGRYRWLGMTVTLGNSRGYSGGGGWSGGGWSGGGGGWSGGGGGGFSGGGGSSGGGGASGGW